MTSRAASSDEHEPLTWRGYLDQSRQPIQILVFLLPLILVYEIGLAVVLRSKDGVLTNKAHETLLVVFRTLGVSDTRGLFLGGVAIAVVLIVWQFLSRAPWRADLRIAGIMTLESLALTIPLLLLGQAISQLAAPLTVAAGWSDLGIAAKATISVGAGLYEELLFRMILIAVLHTLLVDLGKASNHLGTWIAVVVSAAAFTWYHPLGTEANPAQLSPQRVVFFFLAGLFFGAIYVFRGFGIVVAVHAFYDVLTVLINAMNSGPDA